MMVDYQCGQSTKRKVAGEFGGNDNKSTRDTRDATNKATRMVCLAKAWTMAVQVLVINPP